MATKKTAAPAKAAKAAPKKAAAKKCGTKKCAPKPAAKTAAKKRGSAVGSKYSCSTCGLVVAVDTACGCLEMHELTCCGTPMKAKK
ncbi:MAG TPA: hypothetical protein VK445_00325 [Dissulfurispiraceae bacterium]|nr:hypothetical protein [Dissulfurispiraceae bacterium]